MVENQPVSENNPDIRDVKDEVLGEGEAWPPRPDRRKKRTVKRERYPKPHDEASLSSEPERGKPEHTLPMEVWAQDLLQRERMERADSLEIARQAVLEAQTDEERRAAEERLTVAQQSMDEFTDKFGVMPPHQE